MNITPVTPLSDEDTLFVSPGPEVSTSIDAEWVRLTPLQEQQSNDGVGMTPTPSLPTSSSGNKDGEISKRKAEELIDGPSKKPKISRRSLYNKLKADCEWEPSRALQARLNLFMIRPPQPRYDTAVVAYAQHYCFVFINQFLFIGETMIGPKFHIGIWYRPNLDGRGQLFPEPCASVAPISKLKLTDIDLYDYALEAMFGAERLKSMRAEALNGYIKDVWCYAAAFPGVRAKFERASDPPLPPGTVEPLEFKYPSWALSRIIGEDMKLPDYARERGVDGESSTFYVGDVVPWQVHKLGLTEPLKEKPNHSLANDASTRAASRS
ncbi:hypothetical protein KCU78_g17960, partial [Aureobasidium melanogenum]